MQSPQLLTVSTLGVELRACNLTLEGQLGMYSKIVPPK